jgi:hypothetical protein
VFRELRLAIEGSREVREGKGQRVDQISSGHLLVVHSPIISLKLGGKAERDKGCYHGDRLHNESLPSSILQRKREQQ